MGAVAAVLLIAGGYSLFGPKRIPPLTQQPLDRATKRWEACGISNYEMDIQLGGIRTEKYHVRVRNGFAESATLDGNAISESRLLEPWTVAGMLQTAKRDLDLQLQAANDNRLRNLFLRAEFAEESGLPLRYVRVESGTPYELTWRIENFSVNSH